jgi:5'-methylthioadenosine phosphorylase
MYRAWGADVIGMTAMPEARLAREAELPYAILAMVTDYDSWREDGTVAEVGEILEVMAANAEIARAAMVRFLSSLPEKREPSPIDVALDGAVVTPAEKRDPGMISRLDAIMGRVLR